MWTSMGKSRSKSKNSSRGFTLIAALLMIVVLSAVAVGLLYTVSNEARAGGNGLEDNVAYYAAESGMEKLTTDLSALYQTSASPTNGQIQNLINFPPTQAMVGSVNYAESITYNLDANGNPVSSSNIISSGPNQGLYAEIVPMTLQVNATRPSGASVNMTRTVEVALIPVFQFGVFCGYDCSYFAGPNFSFGGRVHTNGNLFLASGNNSNLVFNDKVAAFGELITDELENGFPTPGNYNGTVWVPNASAGCPLNTFPPNGANCINLPNAIPGDASWSGGVPPAGVANAGFPSTTAATFNGFFLNGATGATNLQLPFVQNSCTSNPPPCTDPIQLIRKPVVGEVATTTIGQSREYNKAQIRILLADTQADLHPERGALADGQDFQFNGSFALTGGGNEFFGMAQSGANNWIPPVILGTNTPYNWSSWPLLGEITTLPPNPGGAPQPGGVGAWLRVEYLNNAGAWVGVTREWLGYGFGRALNTVPTGPSGTAGQNAVNPQAILILQQLWQGAPTGAGTQNNWNPINFYDSREGEVRDDNAQAGCAVNGIMNAVEIDVGNLALWLRGANPYGAGTGRNVNFTNQNGYVLYFSDRRGMLPDPNQGNVTSGGSGLEDVVNAASAVGTPDGIIEPTTYYTYSPEDVDQNGLIDKWGGANIGNGFGVSTISAPNGTVAAPNPFTRILTCTTIGATNAVTGARHVLKLVDGSLGNLPVRWDNNLGGFTVASESPVYVQGNYNSSAADPFWANNVNNNVAHSAAAIIADAVTVLSNQWSDASSLAQPVNVGARSTPNQDTYYRMAVAGGKNIPFPRPGWAAGNNFKDFGTDGGLHNFLRYLENWGNVNLWYDGSLVSMYYAEYDTGTFKCCNTVYSPPTRKYYFDTLFLNPANLPPGTPNFQDVVNLSYHQNYTPQ